MAIVQDLSGNSPINLGTDKHISAIESVNRSYPVTASDTVDIAQGVTEALNVTTAGAYKVTYGNGVVDTVNLAAGIWHPINVRRVWSTGSVATSGISAGY